ncbi:hypothetical protein [Paludisphaera borealis]|uniref:Uncharacterized protein n=1 Tax=Paludisphaera borealis TaxID=1387353 RepID=A0A1U7CKD0_9BACT|nr:hypothetical protein [Paludisphaera borealis]APW59389.1 hypothetical protein BSF38_00812 [Paludisphaera borealis]
MACLAPTGERLLCVGESSSQVRAAYAGAWGEVIRDEDRPTVRAISLQRWAGQFWSGQWEHQMYLAVPATRTGKAAGGEVVDGDAELDGDVEVDPDAEPEVETDEAEEAEVEAVLEDEEDDLLETGGSSAKKN